MSDNHSHLWPGVPFALGSAILFGASAPLSKLLIGSIDPWLLAGILYLGAGAGLAIVHWGRPIIGLPNQEAPLQKADLPWLMAVILFGGLFGPLFLMLGLSQTTAASGSLLLNLEGLATMAIAWLVFRENVERRLLLGAAAILAGAVLLSWNGQALRLDTGGLFIAAACLAWGVDNNLTRKLSSADPVQIALIKGLVAGATNCALALYLGASLPAIGLIGAGALVGLLGIGCELGHVHARPSPLGHGPNWGLFLSCALHRGGTGYHPLPGCRDIAVHLRRAVMALGLWLHLSERHDHEHFHEALEHDHLHVHDEHHRHMHDSPVSEPHSHWHRHAPLRHKHVHYPDLHHRHDHQ